MKILLLLLSCMLIATAVGSPTDRFGSLLDSANAVRRGESFKGPGSSNENNEGYFDEDVWDSNSTYH